MEDVVIIGSGCAGLSAAIYTAREDFHPLVISGVQAGGQLILTTTVENYPGFPEGVQGPELVAQMRKQAERFGARFIDDEVSRVDLRSNPKRVFVGDKVIESRIVVIATGASAKLLGLESEHKFMGKGVSTCGTCDGPLFKNKNVIVVGGGDTAMEDSLFIAKFANSVTIVHRRDALRGSKIMQERARSNPKIKFIWDTVVEEITGDTRVRGVRLKNVQTNRVSEMPIDGVFVAIGYAPNTGIVKDQLKLDEIGYIMTTDEVKTDIEGIFVAGDVSDRFYRQAATATGSGVKAALQVREYLSMLRYQESRSKPRA